MTRSDGTLQVTYRGLPLYFFQHDMVPGETKGNYTGAWSSRRALLPDDRRNASS